MKQVTANNNSTILRSFGVGEVDTLQKGTPHKKHKYLEIKDGKYIYDYDKMSSQDHDAAAEVHRNKAVLANRSSNTDAEGVKDFIDLHWKEKVKHEKLAIQKRKKRVTMNNLDWGKTTAERNENLDKYDALKTDEEKDDFLRKLKGKKEMSGFTTDEEDEKMSAEEHLERAEYHKKEKIKNVGGDHLYVKYLQHSNAEKAHRKMAEERKKK